MRKIGPHETCYTALEIVQMFKDKTGIDLHPTLVGQSAKKRDLDYLEIEEEIIDLSGKPRVVLRKQYGKGDLPVLFADLQDVADQRALYDNCVGDLFPSL
jgi:hypothetical protein